MIRFLLVCTPFQHQPSFLYRQVSSKVIAFWAAAILLPSAIVTVVLFVFPTATGVDWTHGLIEVDGVLALHSWQQIPDWKKQWNRGGIRPLIVTVVS